jgi:hypothetical protein
VAGTEIPLGQNATSACRSIPTPSRN